MPDLRAALRRAVKMALAEDIGRGDLTSLATIPPARKGRAIILLKQPGVICGQEAAREVFRQLDHQAHFHILARDGRPAQQGTKVATIQASLRALLAGERSALNFLMHLSGIATQTALYVHAVRGTQAVILDTRKTAPGLRLLEKAAVRAGGGVNHRTGLFDMYLIKDNHIAVSGSLGRAIENCLRARRRRKFKIEVETRTLAEVRQALHYDVDRIMLDNMKLPDIRRATALIHETNRRVEIEVSGNVTLENVHAIAAAGVDFISVGRLTHSAPALDMSLEIEA